MAYFKMRFINSDDFVGHMIDWVTNSLWDHCEIETETGTYIGAHAGDGVQERAPDYCNPTRERRYAIPCSDEQLAAILASAREDIGIPYNYLDIAGLFLHNRGLNSKRREICSEWLFSKAWGGKLYMLNCLPDYAHLITPETLHLSSLLIGNCTYNFPKAS